jgi:hypothetical protein
VVTVHRDIRDVCGMDPTRYALVTDDDLTKHVGERVRIEGKTVASPSLDEDPPYSLSRRASRRLATSTAGDT